MGTMTWIATVFMALGPMRGGMLGIATTDPEITRVADAYVAAMLASDASAVAALYRDDAIEMPPGRAPIRGRAAIENYYRELFADCRFTAFALTHAEVRAAGDVGYSVGVSRQVLSPGGRAPVEIPGKYVVVLKKAGGDWKVAYAIYNCDGPCPPAGPPPR